MNHNQREILEDSGYFDWWDYWDYENEIYFSYYGYEDQISYERMENGLVDWSEEIPQAVKRQHKIDQILNENLTDNTNNLGKFWPK
jgi:hypothetical protein